MGSDLEPYTTSSTRPHGPVPCPICQAYWNALSNSLGLYFSSFEESKVCSVSITLPFLKKWLERRGSMIQSVGTTKLMHDNSTTLNEPQFMLVNPWFFFLLIWDFHWIPHFIFNFGVQWRPSCVENLSRMTPFFEFLSEPLPGATDACCSSIFSEDN